MLTDEIKKAFEEKANQENAVPMAAYMKNRFEFLGIKSQLRKEIQRPFMKQIKSLDTGELKSLLKSLWLMPFREYQYFAAEILEKNYKRFDEDYIVEFEWFITTKSWWDSVDAIVPRSLGGFLKLYPSLVGKKVWSWVESENIWLNRAAVLFQLKYRGNTDTALLFEICSRLKDTGEFFVDKAIGWALREYSKTNPEEIITFVESNKLSNLSHREALKVINQRLSK